MKKILLSVSAVLAVSALNAQSTLTGSDLNPAIGHSSTTYTSTHVSEGPAGANQTWDLTGLTNGGSTVTTYTSSSVSGANIHANMVSSGGTSTADMQFDNSGQYWHVITAGGTVITYSDPMMQLGLPLTYQGTMSDDFHATFTSGISFVRSGTNTQTVDGYGTVITPEGTFANVLRVHLHQDYSDVATGYELDYVVDVYTWYKAGVKDPIASVSSITTTVNGNPTTSSYGSYLEATGLGITENEIQALNAYPNPATSNINLGLSEEGISNILVTDVQGKIYTPDYTVMGDKVVMNTSDMRSGIYFIRAEYASGKVEAAKVTRL